MKKSFFRALIVGILFVFVYYAFQIIQGMYLTMKYVPNIVEAYESVDHLQNKVTFGYKSNLLWRMIEILAIMLLGIVVYYAGRILRRKKLRNHEN
jgi:quinol-cytochrome oxidoreductase complex cytochrome b subunit